MEIFEVAMGVFDEAGRVLTSTKMAAPKEFIIVEFMGLVQQAAQLRGRQNLIVRMERQEWVDGRETPAVYSVEYRNYY